jgi:hypothetical protein
MSFSTYKGAKNRGYTGGALLEAFMWLDSDSAFFPRFEQVTSLGNPQTKAVQKAGDFIVDTVDAFKSGSDIISWVISNWQVSVVGSLALLLLIKRL